MTNFATTKTKGKSTMELKNTDKVKVGVRAYNTAISEWGTITEVSGNLVTLKYDEYEDEDGNNEMEEDICNVYPIAEGIRLDKDKDVKVCYEVNAEVDYEYYVPELDENAYSFEVTNLNKIQRDCRND